MKPSILYALKVSITTFITSVPSTMIIGMAYINLLMWKKFGTNFNFNFNIAFIDVGVFSVIIGLMIWFAQRKLEGKEELNIDRLSNRFFISSIAIFISYLFVTGKLSGVTMDNFLFSYLPMFVISYVCIRFYHPHKKNVIYPDPINLYGNEPVEV